MKAKKKTRTQSKLSNNKKTCCLEKNNHLLCFFGFSEKYHAKRLHKRDSLWMPLESHPREKAKKMLGKSLLLSHLTLSQGLFLQALRWNAQNSLSCSLYVLCDLCGGAHLFSCVCVIAEIVWGAKEKKAFAFTFFQKRAHYEKANATQTQFKMGLQKFSGVKLVLWVSSRGSLFYSQLSISILLFGSVESEFLFWISECDLLSVLACHENCHYAASTCDAPEKREKALRKMRNWNKV